MNDITLTRLSAVPRIRVLPDAPPPDAALEARVLELWSGAVRARGHSLADEPIFSLLRADAEELNGRFVPYRYFLAQRLDAALRPKLRVRPLAVTGIVWCRDGVVIGRRDASSTQHPDTWDFLPAGGIDVDSRRSDGHVDAELQLRKELREELGVELGVVKPRPLWLMADGDVVDIVFGIDLPLDAGQVSASFARLASREHGAIDVIGPAALAHAAHGRRLSASCRTLLGALARELPHLAEVP